MEPQTKPKTNRDELAFCQRFSGRLAEGADVDIEDVSVLTVGEAKGHGILIDGRTLETALESLGDRAVPAYITHGFAPFEDRLTREVGHFNQFSIEGEKLRAGRFSFLQSFKKHRASEYETLTELVDKTPDAFGVSIVFDGYAVWPMEDGEEVRASRYEAKPPKGALTDEPVARVTNILSIDFVDAPAANDGLFRRGKNTNKEKTEMSESNTEQLKLARENEQLATKLEAANQEVTTLKAKVAHLESDVKEAVKAARDEAAALVKMGIEHGKQELALKAIEDGKTQEQFVSVLLDSYKAGNKPPAGNSGATGNVLTRAEFNALDHKARGEFFKNGGTIKEAN